MAERSGFVSGVIFDNDGTLVDTEPLWFSIAQRVAKDFGREIPDQDRESFKGVPALSLYILNKYSIPTTRDNIRERIQKYFLPAVEDGFTPALPGAVESVKLLYDAGYPLAIASSSHTSYLEAMTAAIGVRQYLKHLVGGDRVPVGRGKPNPDIYILAAEDLKIDKRVCLAIEDSITGIKAARAAEMYCIAVIQEALPSDCPTPDTQISSLKDLSLSLVKSLGYMRRVEETVSFMRAYHPLSY